MKNSNEYWLTSKNLFTLSNASLSVYINAIVFTSLSLDTLIITFRDSFVKRKARLFGEKYLALYYYGANRPHLERVRSLNYFRNEVIALKHKSALSLECVSSCSAKWFIADVSKSLTDTNSSTSFKAVSSSKLSFIGSAPFFILLSFVFLHYYYNINFLRYQQETEKGSFIAPFRLFIFHPTAFPLYSLIAFRVLFGNLFLVILPYLYFCVAVPFEVCIAPVSFLTDFLNTSLLYVACKSYLAYLCKLVCICLYNGAYWSVLSCATYKRYLIFFHHNYQPLSLLFVLCSLCIYYSMNVLLCQVFFIKLF